MRVVVLALIFAWALPLEAQEAPDIKRSSSSSSFGVSVTVLPSCKVTQPAPQKRPEARCSHDVKLRIKERPDPQVKNGRLVTFEF